jgi:hypothetical protein
MLQGATHQANKLRLRLVHNPDNEGNANDMTVPPDHSFSQQITADITLDDSVRHFLCVVFTAQPTPTSFDAASPTFFTTVGVPTSSAITFDTAGHPQAATLIDLCGTSRLPAFYAPTLASGGKPTLPDIAMAIPLSPAPTGFSAGTTFGGWLARGILYINEESELAPELTATVVSIP